MAKKRRKVPARVALSRLCKKADRALSLYCRAKTAVECNGLCSLCQVNPIEACFHFVRRRRKILRWDIRNVTGSCHRCNYIEYRNPDPSRAWYIRRYGVRRYLALVDKSAENFEPTAEFLQATIDRYTRMLAYLMRMVKKDEIELPEQEPEDEKDPPNSD